MKICRHLATVWEAKIPEFPRQSLTALTEVSYLVVLTHIFCYGTALALPAQEFVAGLPALPAVRISADYRESFQRLTPFDLDLSPPSIAVTVRPVVPRLPPARVHIVCLAVLGATLYGCGSGGSAGPATAPPTNTPPGSQNRPPTISGSPASSVQVGHPYSFTPRASDPDGDKLTFSVRNLPSWAAFNSSTGAISGQPTVQHEGKYHDIVVIASDGSVTTATRPFSITVTSYELGAVTLTWHPPTHYEDGTPLLSLSGFNIYYGFARDSYPFHIQVDNPGLSAYVIDNLAPDTYFFVATAYDAMGRESVFSTPVSATVN